MTDAQTTFVRTVLGDVPAHDLGVTNSHDHLFFRSPMLPGQELDDDVAATAEARAFHAAGGRSVIQWTPRGLGRHRSSLAGIATATGLHVVSATGRHRAVHHSADIDDADRLADAFITDITSATTPSGLIKVGTGYHHLDTFERISLAAAATAQLATGVPIAIHLELGTAGDLVLEFLTRHHVRPTSIVLGHVGRNPENAYLLELAASGAFLCFDGPSRANHQTDWRSPDCVAMLAEHGHLDQLLVGGDTTTAAARSVTAGPGMPGLLHGFGRRIRQQIGETGLRAITVTNPARAFAVATGAPHRVDQ